MSAQLLPPSRPRSCRDLNFILATFIYISLWNLGQSCFKSLNQIKPWQKISRHKWEKLANGCSFPEQYTKRELHKKLLQKLEREKKCNANQDSKPLLLWLNFAIL